MSIRIKLIPIMPRRRPFFDVPAGHAAKEIAMRQLGEETQAEFEKTVATWEDKPDFTINNNQDGVTVGTRSMIYTYLDKGTRVRYATMSPDFSPKTRSRVIGSTSGRGRMVFVDRNHPKPGIQAREFSVVIREKMQAKFGTKFRAVLQAYKTGEAPGL